MGPRRKSKAHRCVSGLEVLALERSAWYAQALNISKVEYVDTLNSRWLVSKTDIFQQQSDGVIDDAAEDCVEIQLVPRDGVRYARIESEPITKVWAVWVYLNQDSNS